MKFATSADQYFAASGQARLRYRDEGAGPAVLLVHGWLLDLTMWESLAAALAARFRVIRWDRRGFGESRGTPDLNTDAADAIELMDRLGVERTAVVGMSQGCRIALNVVESAPHRARCLVLDGPAPLDGLPDRPWHNEIPLTEYRALLLDRGIDALRAELATHPLLQLASSEANRARLDSMLLQYQGADLLGLAPAAPAPVPENRFGRLRLPVLLLNGEHDTEQRLRVGATLLESIPNAERGIVPASRHMACWDNPTAYNEFVRSFLVRNLAHWA
jgi:pimeloyl-ACP methyl ester carboxylesterase